MPATFNLSLVLLAAASISACSGPATQRQARPAASTAQPREHPLAATVLPAVCGPNAPAIPIDAYKKDVAYLIVRANPGHTFDGRLPPMLPAIVVVRLSVAPNGALADAVVQRSRDDIASRIALESVKRAGYFPSPCGLTKGSKHPFSFSETFLFNDRYEFQLRSIAGAQ